jgi:ATP-dependent Zn protease
MRRRYGILPPSVSLVLLLLLYLRSSGRRSTWIGPRQEPAQQVTFSELAALLTGGRIAEVRIGPRAWEAVLQPASGGTAAHAAAPTRRVTPHRVRADVTQQLLAFYEPALAAFLKPSTVTGAQAPPGAPRVTVLRATLGERLAPVALLLLPLAYAAGVVYWLHRVQNPTDSVGRRADKGGGGGRADGGSSSSALVPTVTFSDVGGAEAAVTDLAEVLAYLRHPERFHAVGARCPRGVLLHGPPGTGKTLLARAVAGECGVAFLTASATDFVEVYVGRGAARVRDLFARARAAAPCVVFIDELDALGRARGGGNSHDEREQTLNALLVEMDGFFSHAQRREAAAVADAAGRTGLAPSAGGGELPVDARAGVPAEAGGRTWGSWLPGWWPMAGGGCGSPCPAAGPAFGVVVLAATNRLDVLDPALTRAGRFDRHVRVGLPDAAGRRAILQLHAARRGMPLVGIAASTATPPVELIGGIGQQQLQPVDFDALAGATGGLSGAELENVVNEAALSAMRAGKERVDMACFEAAVTRVRAPVAAGGGERSAARGPGGFGGLLPALYSHVHGSPVRP